MARPSSEVRSERGPLSEVKDDLSGTFGRLRNRRS
jgi:hypothetical protein